MFFSQVVSTQEYTMYKARNTTDFPNPVKRFTKNRSSIQTQITRLPLDAFWGYQTWKLRTLSWTHPPPFLTRVCQSSTHDFCVLPLQICKVKCDWFMRAYVTEIILVTWVRRRYFRQNQWQPEIRLHSQANCRGTLPPITATLREHHNIYLVQSWTRFKSFGDQTFFCTTTWFYRQLYSGLKKVPSHCPREEEYSFSLTWWARDQESHLPRWPKSLEGHCHQF